ncbi:4'-phosphopantetheinyl transferase superfamily protein [Streptomyces sp. Vc74B-19]|uniref:4'-phosphopantetheinyl transferase family protein n=1 Tax=unclassified Streptomyces TaxID=2593676 RepID=UPI001BFC4EAA|nr:MULTISPECIES: 4'-phosphopantetheinyl transferase superfamily protein [unclassified Streptomyces]MBT3164182.1 4'-phosphopantetheinyl transferase superfamily protein [Streptomyces sp. Vc74B-19]MCO4697818.1 4'-phosphopantetheinyl transferase superfamily protein [Streptomyces sp. RO-S4]
MIEELLPPTVAVVEAYGDEGVDAPLFPEEEALITRAVPKRRREFTAVRSCARRAMEKLGVPARAVVSGERGAPVWPDGLNGSMTHCEGYCAAALVRAGDLASVGIDAEAHGPLPEGVLTTVSLPQEAERIARLTVQRPDVHWDRLLFSAKESVYKAWFPLTGKWLDFSEADITIDLDGTFHAALLVPGPVVSGRRLTHFTGHWTTHPTLLATAVPIPHT